MEYKFNKINMQDARKFVHRYHYAKTCPSTTKYALGIFKDRLVGVAILGFGVRPKHTIKKLFPSLDTKDYLELNRLCLLDECPKNSESWFIARIIKWIKKEHPEIKILFSWADGMRNKPGFVYQSSSFHYGGFIWSEFYVNKYSEVIHPRLLITRYKTRKKEFYRSKGLIKVRGKQYRYCKFLCGIGQKKRLLKESPFDWNFNYPKLDDIEFKFPDGKPDNFDISKLVFTQITDEKQTRMQRWCKENSTSDNQLEGVGAKPTRCTNNVPPPNPLRAGDPPTPPPTRRTPS